MKKLLLSLLFIVAAVCASAQVTTSSLGGHVYGEDRQPLVGATVKATHTPTGTNYTATTLSNGRYAINGMRVGGPYTVEVTYLGYFSEKHNNITLSLGEEATLNFNLKEEATQIGEVIVSATTSTSVFNTNRTGSEEIISSALMEKMPAINRSLSDYTRLAPTSMSTGQGNSYGGVSGRFNNVTVDGASFNNSFGLSSSLGASGIEPISLEAIEQIQVMISPFDVRNGGFTGGGVNSVTKSGSNQWNASAYTYFKNGGLEGIKQGKQTVDRPDYSNKQYGVSLSGPIIKNKLFFFVNAEIDRQANDVAWRPAKAGETGGPDSGGISTVTESYLQGISDYLQSSFGYNPGSYNVSDRPVEGNRITARLDWNLSSNTSLSVKYYYLKSFTTNTASTSGATGSTRGPNYRDIPFSSAYYRTNNNFNIFMADLTTKINDRMHNTLKVGASFLRDFRDMDGGFFPQVDILSGSEDYTVTTFGTEGNSYNNMLDTDIYQIKDYLTMTTGKHQLTFGVEGDLRKFKNGFAQNYPGAWKFLTFDDFRYNVEAYKMHLAAGGTWSTFNINNYTPSGSYAAGTTGVPVQYIEAYPVQGDSFPYALIDVMQLGAYVQDKWSIRPNFNVTAGVRFDMPIFLSDVAHNPKFDGQVFQGGKTINTSKLPATRIQVSPRIGFNWDVFSDRTLQVRGGAGLFSGTPPYVWLSNQAGNNGMLFNSTSWTTASGAANLPKAGFSGLFNQNKPADASAAKTDLAVTDQHFKYPTLFKTSIAADWKFWDDWIFTAEFLYSKNLNDIYHQNINLAEDNVVAVNEYTGATGTAASRPFFKYLNNGGTQYISNDAYTVIQMSNTSAGYSAYTTFKLQKNWNYGTLKGLQVAGSYTFGQAKSVTDGSSSVAKSAWQYKPAINPNGTELGYSLGSFNNRVLITASYRKEYAKHFASSIGVVFDSYMPFRYSYAYNGDVNGDGINANDLIYIPRNEGEIKLKSYYAKGFTDSRTPAQMWAELDAFIEQDPYLSKHRGEYAERNGATAPMFQRIDMNFTQDFFFNNRNGQRNIIRLSVDIRNFSNLLNKDWGIQKTTVLGNQQFQFLKLETAPTAANNYTPEYSFVFANMPSGATNSAACTPLTKTYQNFVSYQSRWGIQLGIKYIFN